MGFWKDTSKPFAKAADKPTRAELAKSGARGTVYDKNGRLKVTPIEDVLDEQGRRPKGGRS